MFNYANYFLTLIGLGMIMVSLFLIFSDKLKGEGLYFDLYVKEQEIRKAIAEADEIIDELKYTSEALVDQIEHSINEFKTSINEIKESEIGNISTIKTVSDDSVGKVVLDKSDSNKKTNMIYEYYNKGMDVAEIARLLDIGKGEVSLILSLYNGDVKNGNV